MLRGLDIVPGEVDAAAGTLFADGLEEIHLVDVRRQPAMDARSAVGDVSIRGLGLNDDQGKDEH